jgi:hypothetical protein
MQYSTLIFNFDSPDYVHDLVLFAHSSGDRTSTVNLGFCQKSLPASDVLL